MYIGDCLYTFKTTDEIIKYSSNIGNNKVSLSIGLWSRQYIFLS